MVTELSHQQQQLIDLVRDNTGKMFEASKFKDAMTIENIRRGRQLGKYYPPLLDVDSHIAVSLTNGICMYFWGWYCAKEHVRKFSTLAKYDEYMTHNPMYVRNVRNCILYRNALRKIPVLRKLHKLFINEVKAMGNINAVVLKYADNHSMLDTMLQSRINEVNVSRGKRFSEYTDASLKWQRAKDRRELKESNVENALTISFG